MNREIKFRVWDGNQWSYFKIGQSFGAWASSVYDDHCLHGRQFYQYTGLKDKNGKEIYDGDITLDDNGFLCEIAFGQFMHKADLDVDVTIIGFYRKWKDGTCSPIGYSNIPLFEVIGSIYENPELLKP